MEQETPVSGIIDPAIPPQDKDTFRARLERSAAGRRVNDVIDAADAAVIVAGSALSGQLRDGIDAVREMHNRKQDFRETMRQDAAERQQVKDMLNSARGDHEEYDRQFAKYTREAIDPATGREYTVDVYPDGQGQKINVRDNEAGTVIQPAAPETLSVAMDEGKRFVETETPEYDVRDEPGYYGRSGGYDKDGKWHDDNESVLRSRRPGVYLGGDLRLSLAVQRPRGSRPCRAVVSPYRHVRRRHHNGDRGHRVGCMEAGHGTEHAGCG